MKDSKRKSPTDHANDKKYMIRDGNDNKLWVSKPDKNKVFKWAKVNVKNFISIASSIPIKPKYDYASFYNFFKKLKLSNTICHCHDDLLLRIENVMGLGLTISEDDEIDCSDLNNFTDDGSFYVDGDYEDKLKELYAKYPKKKTIILFTSLDLIYASLTNGTLHIMIDSNCDDTKGFIDELKQKFKTYNIKVSQKKGQMYFDIKLKKM